MATVVDEHLYERDFYAWTQAQASGLRALADTRPNLPLDLHLIAEEIEDLGRSERAAVFSYAQRIIEHLLLVQRSPAIQQRAHWLDEIDDFRDLLDRKLTPTLRNNLADDFEDTWQRARRRVERKMRRHGEDAAALPSTCPYTLDQILGDWVPDED